MNEFDEDQVKRILKVAFPAINKAELQRDLWPPMLKRLQQDPAGMPWFDWALCASVIVAFACFPRLMVTLVYHL